MKQIRRAEMENERTETRQDDDTRNDEDECKQLHDNREGQSNSKQHRGRKQRAAKQWRTISRRKQEAARQRWRKAEANLRRQRTNAIATKRTTMSTGQGERISIREWGKWDLGEKGKGTKSGHVHGA